MHDQLNMDYLAKLREGSLVHRVKAGIIDSLPSGPVANEKVARELGMSVRSLQRRLAEAGTSFRDLLDTSRQEMAQSYIREPEIELVEIAFLLGFSDQSAFSRAFKRWTGNSPNEVRKTFLNESRTGSAAR
jgi:AraC-like DNA-binding protein